MKVHWERKKAKGILIFPLLLGMQCLAYSQSLSGDAEADLSVVELVEETEKTQKNEPGSIQPTEQAQLVPPSMLTTRPSFTDAAYTVPQGSLQVESGAAFTDYRDGAYLWTVPETLLKLGVTQNTELRYTVPNYTYIGDEKPGSLANNFGDTSVGLAHHRMLPGNVDLMLIPILNIPSGANKVSTNSLDPQLRIVGAKHLTKKWLVSSMFETRWNTGKNATAAVVMMPTFINYYSFSPKWMGFLEYASFIPTQGKTSQFIQSGVLFQPTPRQQLDARIAVGLNKTAPSFLFGFGYSFRVDGFFGKSRDYSSFHRSGKR